MYACTQNFSLTNFSGFGRKLWVYITKGPGWLNYCFICSCVYARLDRRKHFTWICWWTEREPRDVTEAQRLKLAPSSDLSAIPTILHDPQEKEGNYMPVFAVGWRNGEQGYIIVLFYTCTCTNTHVNPNKLQEFSDEEESTYSSA